MIYAVIVTYNPAKENLMELIQNLIKSEVIPVIVDNASLYELLAPCKILRLELNYGIAKAQNIGIKYALKKGAEAIIFLDQDSTINDDHFISYLYEPIANHTTKISAPVIIDNTHDFVYPIVEITKSGGRVKHRPTVDTFEFRVNVCISSGTMVEANALIEVGYMTEELFIDYVDTEWCLRAYSMGFSILIIPSARMNHSIGDNLLKIGRFYVPKHNPSRRYYRVRNSFYLLRLNYIPKRMAFREILFSILHQFILIFSFRDEKFGYLRSLCKGLVDGILGHFN